MTLFATNVIVCEMLREMNYTDSLWYRYLPGTPVLFLSLASASLIGPILAAIFVPRWLLLWVLAFPTIYLAFLLVNGP